MKRLNSGIHLFTALLFVVAAGSAWAQSGVVGDLLAGKLVKPKVGQWARYIVTDAKQGEKFVVRQAIVGEERIGRDQAYWVELEVTPQVGYVAIYRMLLTGPASDPKNIRSIVFKNGPEPAQHVEISPETEADESNKKRDRKSHGLEAIETASGFLQAERFEVTGGTSPITVWVNEEVRPSGIVQMRTAEGEMKLANFGVGGEYAMTQIAEVPVPGAYRAEDQAPKEDTASPPASPDATAADSPAGKEN